MSANPPIGRPPDPIVTARFRVDFGAKLSGAFTSCQLASSAVTQVDYKYSDGGKPGYTTQPGLKSNATITLKRALSGDLRAWQWHQEVLAGNMTTARVSGTVSMVGPDGTQQAAFHVINAWPMKVDFAQMGAGTAAAGEETITLACENFYRE